MKTLEQCKLIWGNFSPATSGIPVAVDDEYDDENFFVEWLNEGSALELFSVRIFTDGSHHRKPDTPKARFGRFTVVMKTSFVTPSRHLFVQSQQ